MELHAKVTLFGEGCRGNILSVDHVEINRFSN
jgi:hypothetical protein